MSDKIPVENVDITTDPLEVSRFPFDPVDVTLNKVQEMKFVQKLLKEIKFVQSLDENALRGQKLYWVYTHNIICGELRMRVKKTLETHCSAHMDWIGENELEVNIDPDCKIEKSANHKKKS